MINSKLKKLNQEIIRQKKIIDSLIKRIEHTNNATDDSYSLFQFTTSLEQSVEEKTRLLTIAKDQAENNSRAKSDFLATMSHEIRTPMNGVMGMLELLLNTPINKRQQHLANTAHSSAMSLLTVINDILDFSKIESGKLSLYNEAFNLRDLLEDILDLLAESAQKKNIELIAHLPEKIEYEAIGDGIRLRQVIINLLGNAIKFTSEGEIELSADVKIINETMNVIISIRDTGIGIKEENQKCIFQPFLQENGSSTERSYGGTGLGLSISRDLLQLMGGEINLHSVPDQGSTFTFEVKLGVGEKVSTKLNTEKLKDIRILIVDDNSVNCEILNEQLTHWGMISEIAYDAEQAIKLLKRSSEHGKPFELALLDWHLPGTDGLMLAKEIQKNTNIFNPACAMLSSASFDSDSANLHNDGVHTYLHKPVYQRDLLKCLLNLVKINKCQENTVGVKTNINAEELHRKDIRILLAEDNIINQEVIYEQMTMMGYELEIVDNGLLALEATKNNRYDLVFMDTHMPQMDGFSATKSIRRFEKEYNRDPSIIIALTENISPGVQNLCKEAGMNGYLSKPFSLDDIEKTLTTWLNKKTKIQFTREEKRKLEICNSTDILDISVIDQLRLLGHKCGRDTLGNAIKRYNESAIEQLNTMKYAVINDNYNDVSSIAHSLKSSSGTLGANLVYSSASAIEQLAKNNNYTAIPQSLLVLDKQLTETLQELKNLETVTTVIETSDVPIIAHDQYLLLVDDDQTTLDTLDTAMQQLGYRVDSVNNGEKALQLLEKNNYDLVITDLQMPDMDGYSLCTAIRKRYSVEALPILVLTSTADDVHVQDAYEIGISNFIVKPVNHLNLAYTALFTIQNSRNTHELWHNRQLLNAAEHTAQVSHWSWEINKQKLQFSNHLQRYFNDSLINIKTLDEFINTVGNRSMDTAIKACLANGNESSWEQEITNSDQEESRYILHRFRKVKNKNENSVLIGTVQEISSIRRAEHRITELAFYDTLTKLSSRSSFNEKLQNLIISASRRNDKFALLYLDLDNFKNVNDSFGHDIGDELLIEVAQRLSSLLREDDVASRLGGDEFCLIINNIADELSAANVAQRCLKLLSKSILLAGREIIPHASIGISIYPNDGDTTNMLVKAADTAMYEAKKTGKNQYAFYEIAMTDAAYHRLTIENDLRSALNNKQFELYYQPKISLSTGRIQGVEALIRWNHPEKGLQSPDTFIPDAERMGIICEIGEWVVHQACKQIKLWRNQGLRDISIAVNISPKHFEQETFSEDIAQIVNNLGISPSLIEIEITESTSRDQRIFSNACQKLRTLGFRTAIDDFGTGYSSLSVLKDAAVDVLKIDRAFVRHLPNDSQSSILIGTIIGMSKALGLQVVAEGIETEEQLAVLVAMGCHMAQGYYFSKPIPANEIPALSKYLFRRPQNNKIANLQ